MLSIDYFSYLKTNGQLWWAKCLFSQLQAQLALSPTDTLPSDDLCVVYDWSAVYKHTGWRWNISGYILPIRNPTTITLLMNP